MLEQCTAAWFTERCGRVTASRISDVMASKTTAARQNYKADLITERDTGEAKESFTNAAMEWGTETEPQARAMYAFNEGADVKELGFARHPSIDWSGASPDGLVGEDGLVEIKCPNTATHYKTLLGSKVGLKYVYQMQWQMACTGRKWCDFVSFDPRVAPAKQYFIERVLRDDELIVKIEAAVTEFLAEIETDLAKLNEQYPEEKDA